MAEITEQFWEIGGGHWLAWQEDCFDRERGGVEGNLFWIHPDHDKCKGWHGIDLTSGTRHELIDGGKGDEANLTIRGGTGSILCPESGEHGYVTRGRWVSA